MDAVLPFLAPEECTSMQVTVLTGIYGYVLFTAAGMIGDGSELLLLVPSLAGLVGSIVLPVLGAVPDGMMVLFSGLGERMAAQEQLAVGIGALAGSTIMLLTIPWFLAIYGGRVSMKNGKPNYQGRPKIVEGDNFMATAVQVGPKIQKTSIIMMVTACLYLVVQGPQFMHLNDTFPKHMTAQEIFDLQAAQVNFYSLCGLVACMVCFFGYLGYQYVNTDNHDDKMAAVKVDSIRSGKVTLKGVMFGLVEQTASHASAEGLLEISEKEKKAMREILKPFFQIYDADNNQILSKYEFGKIMSDLKEDLTQEWEMALFDSWDVDKSGAIDFEEFVGLMIRYTKHEMDRYQTKTQSRKQLAEPESNGMTNGAWEAEGDEEDEEEEEEIPDDLKDLSPEEQQTAIKTRACWLMGLGTLMVLIFADPAVGVLNNIGTRLDVSAFYVSFVLAPLASNASELVAAYNYGCKKTSSMMTISLSTLLGAGCMNNTFCLAIFYMLIWYQRLTWNYTAETIGIMAIQFIVGVFALKKTQTMFDATVVLCCYPASIAIVWFIQNIVGYP